MPIDQRERTYSGWQESSRNDVERGFGAVQGTWHVVAHPMHAMRHDAKTLTVLSVFIFHNMRVEESVSGFGNRYKSDDALYELIDDLI